MVRAKQTAQTDRIGLLGTPHRDGTDVDTFIELSNLINSKLDSVDQAIRLIANFADQNTISQPTPLGSFVYKGTAPTAATYNSVGLTGGVVTDAEAQAFNDALATSGVTYTSVDTKEEIQALVDAYRAVLKAADGHQRHHRQQCERFVQVASPGRFLP